MTAPPLLYPTMKSLLTLDVYSHGVRISGYTRETFRIIAVFLERLALKEPRHIPQERRMVMELKKRFYGLTDSRKESFIHRYQLEEFLLYLKDRGLEGRFEINHIDAPVPTPATFDIYDHYETRGYQIPIVEFMTTPDKRSCRLDLQTGKGKAETLYSRIKVPGGWSTMGEMEVGTKVTAWDGTTTHVTGVYPQGTTPVYRVTFWDGRHVDVCPEHLWKAFYVNTVPHRRWRVIDTLELKRLSEMPNPRVYVPLCQSEDGPEVDVTIPPYTLGVLIGDGNLTGTGINIFKPDNELFENIREELLPGHELRDSLKKPGLRSLVNANGGENLYRRYLKEMDIDGTYSWEKYIPQNYLHGSTEQRWALLQGLMDTDGTVNTRETGGAVSFNSTSRRLAGQVQYLVRSLGGIASISERNTQYTYNGEKCQGRKSYDVNIRHPKQRKLFRLPRKLERIPETNQYSEDLKLRVRSVEYLGEEPTQCISIDHPERLYVTNDFIVTHNTYCALRSVATLGVRTVVMVSPKYFGIWEKALKETYKDIDGRYCTVSGSAELRALIEKGVEGDLDYDVIIVSNVTYRSYLESYERFGEAITSIGYLVPPPRFHEALGAGVQINDEFQDDPGLVFRTDVYTNVRKQLYLSATPFTGNEFVTRMIDVMLPKETSCPLPEYDQYINVIGLMYHDPDVKRKDYLTPFKNTYNHTRYEKRLLKAKRRLERYKRMVFKVINGIYIKDREPGQKLLVLCATVDFIKHLTKELKLKYPDLTIGEFVAGSNPKTLQTNDITVSTIKSAGTGQDIIDLREVLLLQATDSKKDNIQILGRLRRMKNWPEHTPRMTYMVCMDIPQQIRYFKNKKGHFDGRVVSHRVMRI